MLVQLLRVATPSLKDLAADAGLTYSAVRMYAKGQRAPSPDVLKRLARAMRARGGELAKAASALERLSRER